MPYETRPQAWLYALRRRLPAAEDRSLGTPISQRAADILNAGKKVAILIGAGALAWRTDEVIAVAEKLGAGVAKALLGKAALPDDLPWVTGSIGLLGTEAQLRPDGRMRHAPDDRLRLSLFGIPAEGRPGARAFRSTSTPAMLSHPLPDARSICPATAAKTLRALLPLLEQKTDRSWREDDRGRTMADWWKTLEARAMALGRIRSTRSASSGRCRRACRSDAIVTSDSGSCANWFARDYRVKRGHDGFAVRRAGLDGRRRPLRHRAPSSRIRTGRWSPWSATAPCR